MIDYTLMPKFLLKILIIKDSAISLSTGRDIGRGKVAYIWISPDPAKAGPTLGGGGGVVILIVKGSNYQTYV